MAPPPKLTRLCYCMELLLLIAMLMLPIVCTWVLFYPVDSMEDGPWPPYIEDAAWIMKENILFLFDNTAIFLVLLQVLFFFRGVRKGELFTIKRIYNTRHIGMTLVLAYFLSLVFRISMGFFYYEYRGDYMFIVSSELYGLLQLVLGAGLIMLSYILEQAKALKDEQDLVI